MPEPTSDVLDRAFESLTRDLAHSPAPGAAAAVSTARRRRRSRVATVAVIALAVAGGGLAVPALLPSGDGVAAHGGSARLDADALENATDGWVGGWEEWDTTSPSRGRTFGAPSCVLDGADGTDVSPSPTTSGWTRFVGTGGATALLSIAHYAEEGAPIAEGAAPPLPESCGTTTTYVVDGVSVRHDATPRAGQPDGEMWLGDVWTVQVGPDRAVLQVATDADVADATTAERVAQALLAGVRDGWTQQPQQPVVDPAPSTQVQLPSIDEDPLREALDGWRGTAPGSGSAELSTPCLREQVDTRSATSTASGSPDGLTWVMAGFEDEASGPAQVGRMADQLRKCRTSSMSVRRLPGGVVVATYGDGGAGQGALWLAAEGDRALVVGLHGASGPMPDGVAEDVAAVVIDWLRQPAG